MSSQLAEIGTDILTAKHFLDAGDVIGMPTETVYGLAGNALSEDAILKIYTVKNRPKFDPLISHVANLSQAKDLVTELPESARLLANAFWPGPLTLLLKKKAVVPDLLTSGLDRMAIRVPNHPLTLSLLESIAFPLAAPSANPFGYVSPTTAKHVQNQLGDKIPYILDGGSCTVGVESTIVGFQEERVIVHRLGGTRVEDLEQVVGKVEIEVNVSSNPAAPGMLKSHYSPGRKLIIGNIASELARRDAASTGIISFKDFHEVPQENLQVLSASGDQEEAARNLFAALRKMDQPHIKVVLAEFVPDEGLGKAINDRLKRASA